MDYTLREWVRLARQHGSIAQAAVASQAAEGGVDEAAVRLSPARQALFTHRGRRRLLSSSLFLQSLY